MRNVQGESFTQRTYTASIRSNRQIRRVDQCRYEPSLSGHVGGMKRIIPGKHPTLCNDRKALFQDTEYSGGWGPTTHDGQSKSAVPSI